MTPRKPPGASATAALPLPGFDPHSAPLPRPVEAPGPPTDPTEADPFAGRLGGTARPPLLGWGALASNGLPPFPGIEVVPPAVVPSPPLLGGGDTEAEWVERLLKAYGGAATSRWPRLRRRPFSWFHYTPGTPGYAQVLGAAHAMFEAEVAPAAWAAWSCDVFRAYTPPNMSTREPPPMRWVYARTRIAERLEWFVRDAGSYRGGRLVFTPRHRELYAKHSAMMAEVMRSDARTAQELQGIARKHFPGASWDEAVFAARREASGVQATLDAQAKSGVWVW